MGFMQGRRLEDRYFSSSTILNGSSMEALVDRTIGWQTFLDVHIKLIIFYSCRSSMMNTHKTMLFFLFTCSFTAAFYEIESVYDCYSCLDVSTNYACRDQFSTSMSYCCDSTSYVDGNLTLCNQEYCSNKA